MRRTIRSVLATTFVLLAGCSDRVDPVPSGPSLDVEVASTAVGVFEGVAAPARVKTAAHPFQASFALRNTGSVSVRYAEVALVLLRQDGTQAYEIRRWTDVTVPANGQWHTAVITEDSAAPGQHGLLVRGRLPGGAWTPFSAQPGAANPLVISAVSGGAFAAVIERINIGPSSVPSGTRPQISATIRNTSTTDTEWQGAATFWIHRRVQRNGVVLWRDSVRQAFGVRETRVGFAVPGPYETIATGAYDVTYEVRSGDNLNLFARRRETFWVTSTAPGTGSCNVPRTATHRIGYRSFTRPPYGFRGATPWLVAVHDAAQSGNSRVEIDFIRLWARVGGVARIVAANEFDDGVFGGELNAIDPWFKGERDSMPGVVGGGVLTIRPSDRPGRVWHPYLEKYPRVDIRGADSVWMEARVRLGGPVMIQAGLDFWEQLTGNADSTRLEEAAAGDWVCTQGVWHTLRLEPALQMVGGITLTTAPAGSPYRTGSPITGSFLVQNFDDDTLQLTGIGIETRRLVNADAHCDWKKNSPISAFGWATSVRLPPGAKLRHTQAWTPQQPGDYCLVITRGVRRITGDTLYTRVAGPALFKRIQVVAGN